MSIIYVLKILSKSTDAETDDRQKKKEDIKMIIERFEPFKVIKNLLKS